MRWRGRRPSGSERGLGASPVEACEVVEERPRRPGACGVLDGHESKCRARAQPFMCYNSLALHKRVAKDHVHNASASHRLQHPGRALHQPPADRPRRRALARGASRRHGHVPRPGCGPAPARRRADRGRADGRARRAHPRAGGVVAAVAGARGGDPRRGHDPARPPALQLRPAQRREVLGRPSHRLRPLDRPGDARGAARRPRHARARRTRRRLRPRHPAPRLGSRGAVAAARPEPHRPGAALHRRRAHARRRHPGDGRAQAARGGEPRGRRDRDRRAVGRRAWRPRRGGTRASRAGTSPAPRGGRCARCARARRPARPGSRRAASRRRTAGSRRAGRP